MTKPAAAPRYEARLSSALVVFLLASCTQAGGEEAASTGASPSDGDAMATAGGSMASMDFEPMTASTPSGIEVRIDSDEGPVGVGENRILIELSEPTLTESEISVDIVSPEMPMMGIRRFPVSRSEDGSAFEATINVPMAGGWNLYVNLGAGEDAARFALEVGGSAHDHAAMGPSEPPPVSGDSTAGMAGGDHTHHHP